MSTGTHAWRSGTRDLSSGQVDLTTVAGAEYITFSASYISPGEATIKRIGLATRVFPGSHTANDVQYWLKKVRNASGRE